LRADRVHKHANGNGTYVGSGLAHLIQPDWNLI
jgi:hypothetical protein